MNISSGNNNTALQNYGYAPAAQNAASGNSKQQSIKGDSFSLSSDLKELMEQTGASRITETTYTRTVYMNSQTAIRAAGVSGGAASSYEMYSSCACCYTYMERTLTLEGENIEGGIMTITGSVESASFSLDMQGRSSSKTFDGESLTDDMRERIRDIMSRQSDISSADLKLGMDRFNGCAGFLADVFGVDMSDLTFDAGAYEKLFGKIDATEDNYIDKSFERLEMLREYMSKLRERMEEILKSVRENGQADAMNAFGSMYFRLETYSYTEITSFADKALAGESSELPAQEKASAAASVKYEKYSYSKVTTTTQRIIAAANPSEDKPAVPEKAE